MGFNWSAFLRFVFVIALPVAAYASPAKRIGPDIENFNPPYSREDPLVARALAAYDAVDDAEAERLSRQLLAKAEGRASAKQIRHVEALFLFARALDGQKRLTEAESAYRQGLAILKGLIVSGTDNERRKGVLAAAASDWARYFEILLRDNLRGQGRYREADLLASIIPPVPNAASAEQDSRTERGVMWLPGIALSPCPGSAPEIRPLEKVEQDQRSVWDSAANAASIAHDEGGAEQILRKRLALDESSFGPEHCETAVDHRKLAQALIGQDRLIDAEQEARRAVAIFDRLKEDHRETVYALQVLSEIVAKQEGAAAAEPYLRRALDIFERRRGADSRETLYVRLDLAANLYAQGKLAEAETAYRRALVSANASYLDSQSLALDVQVFAGYLAGLQGNLPQAVEDYRLACRIRSELVAQAGRGGLASMLQTPERSEAERCSLRQALTLRRWAIAGGGLAATDRPDALLDEAFEAAQLALPSSSADALARAGARIAAATSGSGDLAERYEMVIKQRDAAGYAPRPLWQDSSQEPLSADKEAQREHLNQDIAEMASRLAREAPRYWELRAPRAVGMAALRARKGPDRLLLRKDEALVLFMVPPGDGYGLVFAVTKDRSGWDSIGMTGAELRQHITRLRSGIDPMAYGLSPEIRALGSGSEPFDRELAYKLYQALFGSPAIQNVIADRKTLIIIPSGPLTTLPPGLLVTTPPAGGSAANDDAAAMRKADWLLRHVAIALLPSVASLRTLRQLVPPERGMATDPLLAFADPDFSGAGSASLQQRDTGARPRGYAAYFRNGRPFADALRELPPLPETRTEGMALAAALGASPASVLTGPQASKAELMRRNADGRLARARVLEFATHGLVAGDGGELAEPALVLSAGASPEDWLLTASEAATLRLHADWVLLSACNTASPDSQDAEGLSGLVRAFFYAGAPALLVSHWSIGDDSTARLVPATIRLHRMGHGLSRAEALQRASLAILDDPQRDEFHPVYWAPFTLVGDPQ